MAENEGGKTEERVQNRRDRIADENERVEKRKRQRKEGELSIS